MDNHFPMGWNGLYTFFYVNYSYFFTKDQPQSYKNVPHVSRFKALLQGAFSCVRDRDADEQGDRVDDRLV